MSKTPFFFLQYYGSVIHGRRLTNRAFPLRTGPEIREEVMMRCLRLSPIQKTEAINAEDQHKLEEYCEDWQHRDDEASSMVCGDMMAFSL